MGIIKAIISIAPVLFSIIILFKVRNYQINIQFISLILFDILYVVPLIFETLLGVAQTPYLIIKDAQNDIIIAAFYSVFIIIVELIFYKSVKSSVLKGLKILDFAEKVNRARLEIKNSKLLYVLAVLLCMIPWLVVLLSPSPLLYLTKIGYFDSVLSKSNYGGFLIDTAAVRFHLKYQTLQYCGILGILLVKLIDTNNRWEFLVIRLLAFIPFTLLNGKRTLPTLVLLMVLAIDVFSKNKKKYKLFKSIIVFFIIGLFFVFYSYASSKINLNKDWYSVFSEYFFKSTSVKVAIYSIVYPDKLKIIDYPGQSVLFNTLFFVPRKLWESKPYAYPDYYSTAVRGYYDNWNFQTNIYSEWITNFNIFGFVLAPYLITLLNKIASRAKSFLLTVSAFGLSLIIQVFDFNEFARVLYFLTVVLLVISKTQIKKVKIKIA